jgi:hypothetical protein
MKWFVNEWYFIDAREASGVRIPMSGVGPTRGVSRSLWTLP